ncbi:hypothetical protein KGV52_00700 [Candidatus Gracilibacteria bacterium]|nr:hypothetical protein [Candidatus Gracilibacteria bacterium]
MKNIKTTIGVLSIGTALLSSANILANIEKENFANYTVYGYSNSGGGGTSGGSNTPIKINKPTPRTPILTDDVKVGKTSEPTKVGVISNDPSGSNLDPKTVEILDKAGQPVKKLVVPGEGTWTVDSTSGDITFSPEKGFTKSPTPVKYQAKDTDGKLAEPVHVYIDYPKTHVRKSLKSLPKTGAYEE